MAGEKICLVSWQNCRNFANSVLKVDRVAETDRIMLSIPLAPLALSLVAGLMF
jgi:hypothetical protein